MTCIISLLAWVMEQIKLSWVSYMQMKSETRNYQTYVLKNSSNEHFHPRLRDTCLPYTSIYFPNCEKGKQEVIEATIVWSFGEHMHIHTPRKINTHLSETYLQMIILNFVVHFRQLLLLHIRHHVLCYFCLMMFCKWNIS